jgi:hypothetical protein
MPGFKIGQTGGTDAPSAVIETRRRHRWRFQTISPQMKDILVLAVKADRPKPIIDKVSIHHQQDVIYIPAKSRWEPIDIVFYEAENPDVYASIFAWMKKVVDFSRGSLRPDFRSNATLTMLDGRGQETWRATLINSWPTSLTPDQLDYASADISTITVNVSYDKAQ